MVLIPHSDLLAFLYLNLIGLQFLLDFHVQRGLNDLIFVLYKVLAS